MTAVVVVQEEGRDVEQEVDVEEVSISVLPTAPPSTESTYTESLLLSCHFCVHYHAKQDELLVVVGNCPELGMECSRMFYFMPGNWNPAAGLVMNLNVDPQHVNGTWLATVFDLDPSRLPIVQSEFFSNVDDVSKRQLRYKYCVVERYDKYKVRRWEESSDRTVLLSSFHRTPVLLHDWWQSKPKIQLSTVHVTSPTEEEGGMYSVYVCV